MKWNDLTKGERLAIVEREWRSGLSARQIAEQFEGCTRNAIIGICHRNGLTMADKPLKSKAEVPRAYKRERRFTRSAKARAQRPNNFAGVNAARRAKAELIIVGGGAVMERAEAPASPYRPKAHGPLPESNPKPWLERAFGECAFPVSGEGADTLSCCAPSGERTYCKDHHRIMFVPAREPVKAFVKGVARWAA